MTAAFTHMNNPWGSEHIPVETTKFYGYDCARPSFRSKGKPIFGFDSCASWPTDLNLECSPAGATKFPRFTGKERDSESGLDYFGTRYYGSALGRFSSPDEPLNDQYAADPQSWNLYSYVRNNPLTNVDPTGEDCVYTGNFSTTGTVGVERGNCTQKGGQYFDGTIDVNSLTFNSGNGQLGFSYSNGNTIGSGVIRGLTAPGTGNDELNPYAQALFHQPIWRSTANVADTFLGGPLVAFLSVAQPEVAGLEFLGYQAAESGALTAMGLISATVFNAGRGILQGETTGMTNHALSQALARGVTNGEMAEALTHVPKSTRGSVLRFIGQNAEVRVNQVTGKIVTVIRFSSPGAK
jgi:RHS repeat-associated protein